MLSNTGSCLPWLAVALSPAPQRKALPPVASIPVLCVQRGWVFSHWAMAYSCAPFLILVQPQNARGRPGQGPGAFTAQGKRRFLSRGQGGQNGVGCCMRLLGQEALERALAQPPAVLVARGSAPVAVFPLRLLPDCPTCQGRSPAPPAEVRLVAGVDGACSVVAPCLGKGLPLVRLLPPSFRPKGFLLYGRLLFVFFQPEGCSVDNPPDCFMACCDVDNLTVGFASWALPVASLGRGGVYSHCWRSKSHCALGMGMGGKHMGGLCLLLPAAAPVATWLPPS